MSKFDWESEEDNDYFQQVIIPGSSKRSFHLYVVLSSLIILILVTAAVSARLYQKSRKQTAQVETDIKAAYQLWRQAVNSSDLDLLNTILLGSDTSWMTEQRKIFMSDRIVDRSSFGLQTDSSEKIPEASSYQLAGNWRSVDFSFQKSYRSGDSREDSRPIELIHTVKFHRDGSRWLLGQPNDLYWGDRISIELDNVIATFPERDRRIVKRVVSDLDRELTESCWLIINKPCPQENKVTINFRDDPALLIKPSNVNRPTYQEGELALITPTLFGLPTEEVSYQAIYTAYTAAILKVFKAELKSPSPLPGQQLYLLCTPELGSRQGLYRYDFTMHRLLNIFSGQSFSSFSSLAEDAGLLLHKYQDPREGARLRMIVWSPLESVQLIDYGFVEFQPFPASEAPDSSQPHVLLRTDNNNPDDVRFKLIDGSGCTKGDCETVDLEGFPTWSPAGESSLLWQSGIVYFGNKEGKALNDVAEGFTPFWFTEEIFGLARFTSGESESEVAIYYGNLQDFTLKTLISSSKAAELADLDLGGSYYIQFALTHPKRPGDIIIIGREYAGENSRYHILRLKISITDRKVTVTDVDHLLTIRGTPANFPSSAVPMGQLPIVISPDGTQLAVGRKGDGNIHYWEIYVVDIDDGSYAQYETMYPAETYLHPYFDWSQSSQWLAVVDDGFFQLISPRDEYLRLIAYDMYSCNQIAWVND